MSFFVAVFFFTVCVALSKVSTLPLASYPERAQAHWTLRPTAQKVLPPIRKDPPAEELSSGSEELLPPSAAEEDGPGALEGV